MDVSKRQLVATTVKQLTDNGKIFWMEKEPAEFGVYLYISDIIDCKADSFELYVVADTGNKRVVLRIYSLFGGYYLRFHYFTKDMVLFDAVQNQLQRRKAKTESGAGEDINAQKEKDLELLLKEFEDVLAKS